jgi:hypothetical protein
MEIQTFLWLMGLRLGPPGPTGPLPPPTLQGGRINMPDFIPQSDTQFDAWAANFVTYAGAHLADLGLVAGDMTPVTTAQTAWNTSFPANVTAQDAAQQARQDKDADRNTYENAIRVVVRKMQGSGAVDPGEAAAMGLTVPDTEPTPVGPPTTRPAISVDTTQRLRHILNFRDDSPGAGRGKPAGVLGCEIWVKIGGTAPTDVSECSYLATDTRSPYSRDYDGGDADKTAHYMCRWVSTRHEPGPWAETFSATITA